MLWHDSFDSGTHGAFVLGFRGFLVVQWMVQPLVETGSTGSRGSGQVPVLTGSAGERTSSSSSSASSYSGYSIPRSCWQ
jgi:hypothetical protein